MIALDTNVVVRLLTADDPIQARRAAKLLANEARVFLTDTVLLETEWVLRAAYRLRDDIINSAFRKLLSLPMLEVEHAEALQSALNLHGKGMDFADAMHLCLSARAERFATFDRDLRAKTKKAGQGLPKVVEP